MGRVIQVALVILVTSCAGWQQKALLTASTSHEIVRSTSEIAQPILRETCKSLAEKCVREGVTVKEHCVSSEKCIAVSAAYRDVARGAVLTAAALQVAAAEGNESESESLIAKLGRKLSEVRAALSAITEGDWRNGS